MQPGKNRFTYGYTCAPSEDWKVRINVTNERRLSNAEELIIYKTGFLNYWSIDWLFGIYSSAGHAITEIGLLRQDREKGNNYVLDKLVTYDKRYQEHGSCPLKENMIRRGLYLKRLHELTTNRMLSEEDYILFRKIWHAITRPDGIPVAVQHLKGFNPSRILNNPS
jgi:hypothetical protein